jgi:hypothetical protein
MVMLSHDTYILPLSRPRSNVTGGATAQLIGQDASIEPGDRGLQRMLPRPGVWPRYAPDVHESALPTGRFVLKEAPGLIVDALKDFLD